MACDDNDMIKVNLVFKRQNYLLCNLHYLNGPTPTLFSDCTLILEMKNIYYNLCYHGYILVISLRCKISECDLCEAFLDCGCPPAVYFNVISCYWGTVTMGLGPVDHQSGT